MKKLILILLALSIVVPALAKNHAQTAISKKEDIVKVVNSLPSNLSLVKNFDVQKKAMFPLVAALNIVHISLVQVPKLIGKKILQVSFALHFDTLQNFFNSFGFITGRISKSAVRVQVH